MNNIIQKIMMSGLMITLGLALHAAPEGLYGGGNGRGERMLQSLSLSLNGLPTGYFGGGSGRGETLHSLSGKSLNGQPGGLYAGGAGRGEYKLDFPSVFLNGDVVYMFRNITADSLWSNAGNWTHGIPTPSDDPIVLQGLVRVNTELVYNNLTIGKGSTCGIKLEPSGKLTVTGVIHNDKVQPSTNDIIIRSTADATGSVIFESVDPIYGTIQRWLPGAVGSWHMISSPVNNVGFGSFAPGATEDVYLWHEASPGTWVNYKNTDGSGGNPTFPIANGGTMNMVSGRGYAVNYATPDVLKTYENGLLNQGSQFITLSKSALKNWTYTSGWNLIGNPYPSSINWSQIAISNAASLAEAYAQVYNPNKAGGAGYEQVTSIAPGQGFFVLAATNGAQINISTTDQTHGGAFYKETLSSNSMTLRLSKDNMYDESVIVSMPDATANHDFWDATKMFSFDESIPQLYTLTNENWPLSIQSIPLGDNGNVIPLSIKSSVTGEHSISLQNRSGSFSSVPVILRDLYLNTEHQLNTSDYNFLNIVGTPADRFEILFGAVGTEEPQVSTVKVLTSSNQIKLLNLQAKSTITIFDATGRQVYTAQDSSSGTLTINIPLSKGIYIVRIQSGSAVKCIKINMQ